MASSLLATKTQIPQLARQLVARSHLIDKLEREIPRHRVTLISAPAGFGKSTLLAQWAHSSRLAVAWLSLDEEDNTFERFFRYLLASWEMVRSEIMATTLGVLLGGSSPPHEPVLTAFINVANERSEHTVFVLDDFHLLTEAGIGKALDFLVDHLPPQMHFVLVARGAPGLPLARYRAKGQLWELDAARLAFQREETTDLLNRVMALDLSRASLRTVHTQMEGWVTGLRLVGLTLQRGTVKELDGLDVSGQHRFIADYFFEEVLRTLPDDLQLFLLRTSILKRLCGSLCAAVAETQNGQEILEEVERLGLFLMPLDAHREWYRYHPLFADFLRLELERRSSAELATCHRRAARWFLAQELPQQAFDHALAGDDVDLVLRIFERSIQTKLLGGEFRVVKQWLNALPAAWRAAHPMFGLVESCLLFFTGQFAACVLLLNTIEQRLQLVEAVERRPQLAQVQAVRCSLACFQDKLAEAEAFAGKASENLAAGDHFFRTIIYGSLGDTYRRHARWDEAKACYLELLPYVRDRVSSLQAAHVFGALADLELRQGHLQVAAGYWRKALRAIQRRENWGYLPLPLTGWVYIRAAELFYEWNQLDRAAGYLSQGLERAELGGDVRAILAGYLLSGRLKLCTGDIDAARGYLKRARPLVQSVQSPPWRGRFERLQVELWLARKRISKVAAWSADKLANGLRRDTHNSEMTALTLARALISIGQAESLQESSAVLEPLLRAAEAEGRVSILIEGLALRALASWAQGDAVHALVSLERALSLAERQGYVRLFADLGSPMTQLLQEAHSRDVMPAYVTQLLAAFTKATPHPGSQQRVMLEPLTARELEILNLLAAGLTNREIGERLTISPLTVKTHAANIYSKLGVHGRTEASAKARELDLLS